MTVSQLQRAKSDLAKMIVEELSAVLNSTEQMHGHILNRQAVLGVSRRLVERLIASEPFLEKVADFSPPKAKVWLTTEDAARRSGLSRPLIAALLDSPSFDGEVVRTPKGHRRVAAKDFERWMEKNQRPAHLPTLEEVRSGPREDASGPLIETDDEKRERRSSRDRSLALAKKMRLG